jgi:hypothetical protein
VYWKEDDAPIMDGLIEEEVLYKTTESNANWLKQNGSGKVRIGLEFQADVSALFKVNIHKIEYYLNASMYISSHNNKKIRLIQTIKFLFMIQKIQISVSY